MNKYPKLKIITLYPLFGGILGSLAFGLLVFCYYWITGFISDVHYTYFLSYFMVSFVIGFILNSVISSILVVCKIDIHGKKDDKKVFGVGCLVFGLPSFMFFHPDMSVLGALMVVLGFSMFGGASSVVLARFLLPKSACAHALHPPLG